MAEIYEEPLNPEAQRTSPTTPPVTSEEKYKKYFRLAAGLIAAIGYLIILGQIAGTTDVSTNTLYFLLITLMTLLAIASWLQTDSGKKPIVVLLVATSIVIIINSVWPGASVKSAYESIFITDVVYLDKEEKNEKIDIPDKTNIQFRSNKRFVILERRGTKPDGSFILEPVRMPPGKSERYFTWGGNIVLQGLHDGTKIKISY